jgi:hypothetical protein
MANHILQSVNLDRFEPQALKDTMWAQATAQVSHPKLFHKVAKAVMQRKEYFNYKVSPVQSEHMLPWALLTSSYSRNLCPLQLS